MNWIRIKIETVFCDYIGFFSALRCHGFERLPTGWLFIDFLKSGVFADAAPGSQLLMLFADQTK